MSTKFTPKKTTIGYSVAAIMAGVVANPVQAIVDIDSVAQYDNAITNAKYQEIANRQANDEKVKMRLYDVLHHLGNSSNLDATSKQYIRDNLPSADVLANGSTFQLYNGASSAVGSTVASERTIRLGAGSKINTVGGQLDVDNVANITLGGKTYNFAGSTTEGVVSVGDKTTDTQRTITNVAAGRINATSTDAINGSQLHATNEALKANITQTNTNKTEIAKGINFIDDNGNKANIKQGGTLGLSKADTNVTVDIDSATNKAKIGLADNINVKSVTTGTASMSTTGINAGSMKVTNVADGAVNATSKDAVNGSQLHATNTKVNQNATNIAKGINFGDGNGNTTKINLGGQFNIEAGSTNVTTKVTNGKVTVDAARDQNLNSTTYGGVKISTTGLNNGGNKVTNVADGAINATSKDAVNGSQLHATNTKVNQNTTNIAKNAAEIAKGINFTDDNGNKVNIKQGGTLGLSKADTNVTVDIDTATNKAKIGLADNINVQTVTTGAASMSTTGINAGNMKVTNVADGAVNATSKDAVNGSQLHATNTKVNQNATNIAKGINFGDGNGNTTKISLGGQFNIEAGSTNVTTRVTNGKVTVDAARNQNLDSTTYGNVKISTTGINAGNMKVTNVADGAINATSKDAVNGSQLHATNTKVNQNTTNIAKNAAEIAKGINFTDDNGNTANIKQGGTLGLSKADNNVTVDIDSTTNKARIGLADDINVKTVTADSVTTGTASMSTTGINAGSMKVTNVADGAVNATSKDAINGSQLHNAIKNINTKIGNVVVYDGNTQDQVTLKGPNGTKITNLKDGDVNATSKDAVNGSQLHATNTKVNQNTTNIAKNAAEIAKGINFTDDNGNTANIKQGGTLGLSKADTNVTVDIDSATNKAKIGLADNINVKSVTTGAASMSTTGINAGNMKVTNVADGAVNATSKDAINGSQLHATNTKVNQNTTNIAKNAAEIAKGINFTDDNGNTANIKQGGTLGLSKADNNVTVDIDSATNKARIGLADDINVKTVTADSVTTGTASMSTTGINAGSMKVTNVADGAVNATSKDAVNGSQLHATNTKVNQNTTNIAKNAAEIAKGINFTDDNGNTANIKQGGTLGLSKADTNVTVDIDSATNKAKIGLADNINVKTVTADSVTTGAASMSTTGINAGSMKVTNVADGAINANSTDAVNGSQLHATNIKVNQNTTNIAKGINFGDGNGNVTNVQLGNQFNVEAGSTNVTTKVTNGKVTVDVARNQNLDSTTYGGVKISTTGLNNGGNKVINVADGNVNATSKDAVNGSQLYAVKQLIQNSGSTNFNVAADTGNPTHISTNDTLNINGGKNIQTTITSTGAVQVGLKDDINVKSITVNGGGSITQNGINAGGNRITNVAEGVDGTDAVNVNQLNRVSQNINKIASDASSGTAAAMAVGTLGQAWEPGSSTVSVAGSVYDGKAGWAIGGSNMTDNGKWLIKYNVSGSGNSKFGAAASVTYQY